MCRWGGTPAARPAGRQGLPRLAGGFLYGPGRRASRQLSVFARARDHATTSRLGASTAAWDGRFLRRPSPGRIGTGRGGAGGVGRRSRVCLGAGTPAGVRQRLVDTDPRYNATDSFGLDRDRLAADGRFTLADADLAGRPARDIEHHFGDRFGGRLAVVPGHKGIITVAHRLDAQFQAAVAGGECSDLDAEGCGPGTACGCGTPWPAWPGTGTWSWSTPRRTSGS